MKPETKRRLAIEWLILLTSAVVGIGAILWDKVPYQVQKYWKNDTDPIWVGDASSDELANYGPKPTVRSGKSAATFEVDIEGATYEVDTLDEATARKWALATHQQAQQVGQRKGNAPSIEELSAALVKADAEGNVADARVFANAIREMRTQSALTQTTPVVPSKTILAPPRYQSSHRGQFRALNYALRESLPEAVFLGVLLGIGIYIVLWIPRLTLRAVRIVRAKPPSS